MQIPLQIRFRGIDPSATIEAAIRRGSARLERFGERMTRCQVTVDMPRQRHHRGNHYAIQIDVQTLSGGVAVQKGPAPDGTRKNFQSFVDEAFDAAGQALDECLEQSSKAHSPGHTRSPGESGDGLEPEPALGRVSHLYPNEGYGFLETPDGRQIYFHENSSVDVPFAHLRVGTDVRFTVAPDDGDQGARAASVHLIQS